MNEPVLYQRLHKLGLDMSNCTSVLADNVSNYFFENMLVGKNISFSDFPGQLPVFEYFCVEYDAPPTEGFSQSCRIAVLFRYTTAEPESKGFLVTIAVYIALKNGNLINATKNIEDPTFRVSPIGDFLEPGDTNGRNFKKEVKDNGSLGLALLPALLAVSFMNSSGTTLPERLTAPPSRQQRRHAERKQIPIQPQIAYRVIEIEAMKQILIREGGIKTNGLKQALHICRGHFARYGTKYDRKKLFGKYEGQFWIPQCVKGDPANGIIISDYSVNPPNKPD